jgi:hypothetical protein
MELFPNIPLYRSHKLVRAAKITSFYTPDGRTYHVGMEGVDGCAYVGRDWLDKRVPEIQNPVGGYFVLYEDGYTSWSPAEAFEAGYTKVGTINIDAGVTLLLLAAAALLFSASKMLGAPWAPWYGLAGAALTIAGFMRMLGARRAGR